MHCSALLLAVICFSGAFAWEDNKDGKSVNGYVVNPEPEPKGSLLGKKGDVKAIGANDRNALGPEARWKDGIVPYVIDASFKPSAKAALDRAFQDFHDYTCLKFVPRTTQTSYVKFIDDGDGCYSYVGDIKKPGGQELGLEAPGCDSKGTALHELMHAIGFGHEQCRADRDSFITIDLTYVPKNMQNNFEKYDGVAGRAKGNVFGFKYDFNSIMHYSNDSFGQGHLTMRRKDGQPLVVQHYGFSDYDVQKINLYYECAKKPGFAPKPFTMVVAPKPLVWTDTTSFKNQYGMPPPMATNQWGCTTIQVDATCKTCAGKSMSYRWGGQPDAASGAMVCKCSCTC